MEENTKIISAIAEGIATIDKNVSAMSQQLNKINVRGNNEVNDQEMIKNQQCLIDLNQKLDRILANQKEPNYLLIGLSIGGLLCAAATVFKSALVILHKLIN